MLTSATPAKASPHLVVIPSDRGDRRFDPFRALTLSECERERTAYLEHVRQRDGELDLPGRRLSQREKRVRELEASPVRWQGEMNRDAFYQHFHRVGKPELDARTLWLLAMAVSNEGERFGAEGEIRRFLRSGQQNVDPIKLHHVLQEDHHTRLLLEACRALGLGGLTLKKPRLFHQWIIHAMTYLPDRIRYIFILCGEIVGAVVFKIFHDTCRLFPESPEVEERLRSILAEIVHDESLHVAYCRTHLGPWGLRVARALIPLVTWILMRDLPQLRALGWDRHRLLDRLLEGIEVPAGVDWIRLESTASI